MQQIIELLKAIAVATLENKRNIEKLMIQQGLTPCRDEKPEVPNIKPEDVDLPCMTPEAKAKIIANYRNAGTSDEDIIKMLETFK